MYTAICDISFIYLPVAEQKKIVLTTLMGQNPHYLTIGGFQPLNVETFIYVSDFRDEFYTSIILNQLTFQSLKTTYTVAMLLISSKIE